MEQTQAINKVQQVKDKASVLYKNMDWKEINDNVRRVIVTADYESEEYRQLMSLTLKVSEDTQLSDDSVYEFTMDALSMIADSTAETEEDLQDLSSKIEPDSYTSELTAWLNQSNYHVYYLDEAIRNGASNGFQLLAMAQTEARREVLDVVLSYLRES